VIHTESLVTSYCGAIVGDIVAVLWQIHQLYNTTDWRLLC